MSEEQDPHQSRPCLLHLPLLRHLRHLRHHHHHHQLLLLPPRLRRLPRLLLSHHPLHLRFRPYRADQQGGLSCLGS